MSLLEKVKRGDEAARAEIVERFYPEVRQRVHCELAIDLRRSRPWLASVFSTGDIVQEVFLGVLRDLDQFVGSSEESFRSFLASTVTHRLLDAIRFHEAARRDGRRIGRDVEVRRVSMESEDTSPTRAAARSEEADAVQQAILQLRERDRRLLELRLMKDETFADIATELGMPSADAARVAFRAAQARLLLKLRERGLE